jgi:hypothetical protein
MTTMTPHDQRRECAICFSSQYSDIPDSPQRFYSTPCNHHFHFECLERWCQTNNSCPTCRHDTVMNLPNYNVYGINSTISEIYSIYVNNYNNLNNSEPSSSPENEQPTTAQNNDNLDNHDPDDNNNFSIIDIDYILDNIRNDYNNTGVIRSNNVMALLNLTRTTYINPLWQNNNNNNNNNNYNYVNNSENYYLRDRYRNIITRYYQRINQNNQNNIRNNNQILENNYRRNNVRLNQRRNSVINLDDLDSQIT